MIRVLSAVVVTSILMVSSLSDARKVKQVHVVKQGDSVARIADYYGVSQRDLRELNHLTKGRPLKVGQELKIPHVLRVAGKKYTVQQGDSFASIGEKFHRSPKAIAEANKLNAKDPLSVGRVLVIPDRESSGKRIQVDEDGPAPVMFVRVVSGERERLQLYNRSGKINHQSVQRFSYLARDKRGEQQVKRMHFRLIKMLQALADKYPGKPIEIISGYRPHSEGNESQHAFGRALDFRVPGVSNAALFRFCKQQPRAGCGYYPHSSFVHMDAREKSAFWVDRSGGRKKAE